jgi:hypothetical protein
MQLLTVLSLAATSLPLTQACYRTHGYVQQNTNTATSKTTYLPYIYLEKGGVQIADGHFLGEQGNPFQPTFIPGGIPTNASFSGPWGGFNISSPYVQIDVFGIWGQALIRDNETAFFVDPEAMKWVQIGQGDGVAGIPNTFAALWSWDSGNVHC